MPDVTKCYNTKCTIKSSCYRFKSKESETNQSYGSFKQNQNGSCDMYWGENAESIFNQLKDIVR